MSDRDPLLSPNPRRRRRLHPLVLLVGTAVTLAGIGLLWVVAFSSIFISPQEFVARQKAFDHALRDLVASHGDGQVPNLPPWPDPMSPERVEVLACAESEAIRGVRFSTASQSIDYPWGDVPSHIGTSADLLVRCFRRTDLDLQQLLHHDRKTNPKRYPLKLFARKTPDKSLDHRRVAFLFVFAKAFFPERPLEMDTPEAVAAFQPGDLVFWSVGGREGHPGQLGLVLDRRDASGMPLVATMHPDDARTTTHHRLDTWAVVAHFGLDPDFTLERFLESYPGHAFEPPPRP